MKKLDHELLQQLGWPLDLINAAEQVLKDIPAPIESPVLDGAWLSAEPVATDSVMVADVPPVATTGVIIGSGKSRA